MFTINQYIEMVYKRYDPRLNTVEDAINIVIAKYPNQRNAGLDAKVRSILKDCKDIGEYLEKEKEKEHCANCPHKGRRFF